MEKLWSPWRSQYIDSIKDKKNDKECVFCQMIDLEVNEDSNLLIDKGKYTFTVLNLYPYNNGHLMVVPYRHTSEFSSITPEESSEIFQKLKLAEEALKIILSPEGFNMGANLGKVSGAGIDEHIHFHLVPRWSGDTNFMPVLGEVKIISQDLMETKKKLKKIYEELLKGM